MPQSCPCPTELSEGITLFPHGQLRGQNRFPIIPWPPEWATLFPHGHQMRQFTHGHHKRATLFPHGQLWGQHLLPWLSEGTRLFPHDHQRRPHRLPMATVGSNTVFTWPTEETTPFPHGHQRTQRGHQWVQQCFHIKISVVWPVWVILVTPHNKLPWPSDGATVLAPAKLGYNKISSWPK